MQQAYTKNALRVIQNHAWWVLLICWIGLQAPFIQADPDLYVSHSRDAHSDEGLNTIQLRNYIHHGYLNVWECDNLIKTPLYNLYLFLPFKFFGTYLSTGRWAVLIWVIACIVFIGRDALYRPWLAVLIPIMLLQYHMMQYSHFVMAEMMAISSVWVSLYAFSKLFSTEKKNTLIWLVIAMLSLNAAWLFKIQFIYLLALEAIIGCILLIRLLKKRNYRDTVMMGLTMIILQVVIAALYYTTWYLPNKAAYEYIMTNQASGRFAIWQFFWNIVGENYTRYFTTEYIQTSWIILLICLLFAPLLWLKNTQKHIRWLGIFSLIWLLTELHKITIHHVPSRYLLSGYSALLMYTSTIIYIGIQQWYQNGWIKKGVAIISIGLFATIITERIYLYQKVYNRRTYRIHALNMYLHRVEKPGMTIIGPWAPTATWDTDIRALPVWKDFLNGTKIKDTFKPDAVITEPGEADSDGAFCADGFDIVAESDSVKMVWIGKWPVHIYWQHTP